MSKYSKQMQQDLAGNDNTIFMILLATLFVVPLSVRFDVVDFFSPIIADGAILELGTKVNVFTHAKFVWLVILTCIMLLPFLIRAFMSGFEFKEKYTYTFLLITVIGLLASLFASPFKSIALYGDYMRYEGTFTYLMYLVFIFAALTIKFNKTKLSLIGYFLYPFVILNTVLCLLYFYGVNVLNLSFIKSILFLSKSTTLADSSRLIATLDNINYISGVSSMLIAFFLTWAMFDNNTKRRVINLLMALASVSMMFASTSRSGFITFIFIMLVLIFIIYISSNIKQTITTLLVFILGSSLIFLTLVNHNKTVWTESFGFVISTDQFLQSTTGSDDSEPETSSTTMGSQQPIIKDADKYLPSLPETGLSAGSGRTYIWSKTLDLIKESPIFGYGMDTFTYVFPQEDPQKNAGLGSYSIIVDKPHNMYLGYVVGGGVITLIGILGVIMIGLYRGIKWLISTKVFNQDNVIVLSLFLASIAYFIQGLFNDSVIGVSTIGWILYGVFLSVILKPKQ